MQDLNTLTKWLEYVVLVDREYMGVKLDLPPTTSWVSGNVLIESPYGGPPERVRSCWRWISPGSLQLLDDTGYGVSLNVSVSPLGAWFRAQTHDPVTPERARRVHAIFTRYFSESGVRFTCRSYGQESSRDRFSFKWTWEVHYEDYSIY